MWLREYIWSLTFVALLLGAYTFIIWQHSSSTREPASATAPVTAPAANLDLAPETKTQ